MKHILVFVIRIYQKFISPLFSPDMQILSYLFDLFYSGT